MNENRMIRMRSEDSPCLVCVGLVMKRIPRNTVLHTRGVLKRGILDSVGADCLETHTYTLLRMSTYPNDHLESRRKAW